MLTGSVEYTKLNPMQNKTKEERQAIAAKSHAARQWVPLIGIYFLIKERKIIYIGQSNNILTRITTHSNSKDFDSYSYIPCDESILDKLESLYIHVYQPELNGFLTEGRKHAPIQLHELLGIAEGVSTIRNTISQTKWGK